MPSKSHRFIKELQDRNKLQRNYTQNIDTLEQKIGITKIIQCHGSFATASCIDCKSTVPGEAIKSHIMSQTIPFCSKCVSDPNDEILKGVMKPDITFFGEKLPGIFDSSFEIDRECVDLLVVIGSSLKVMPVSGVICNIYV